AASTGRTWPLTNARSAGASAGCCARGATTSAAASAIHPTMRRTGALPSANADVGRPFQGRRGEAESLALQDAAADERGVGRPFQGRRGEAESLALQDAAADERGVGRPFQGRRGEAESLA